MTYKPKPKTKEMPCRHCNRPMTVGWKTKKRPAHVECSIMAALDAATQMHNKTGPLYDRWRMGMANFLDREGIATPGGIEKNDLPDHELRDRANTITM